MPINLRSLANAARMSFRVLQKFRTGPTGSAGRGTPTSARQAPPVRPALPGAYPGDFGGKAAIRYAPQPDGSPDPGEIV